MLRPCRRAVYTAPRSVVRTFYFYFPQLRSSGRRYNRHFFVANFSLSSPRGLRKFCFIILGQTQVLIVIHVIM